MPADGRVTAARRLARRAIPFGVRRTVVESMRRLRAIGARAIASARRAVWRAAVTRLLLPGGNPRLVSGRIDPAAIPLVMCLWNRPWRFEASLAELAGQVGSPTLRLILWNNRRANDSFYLAQIARAGARGAIASIEFRSSRVNIGGIARFLIVRKLRLPAGAPFFMLDDDERIADHFVTDLLAAYAPRTYAGYWAFAVHGGYWEREPATATLTPDYVGTGGSVCDAALVRRAAFFHRLPNRYGFLEDIWASGVARSLGWHLAKVDTPIEFMSEADNQYHAMMGLKTDFFALLEGEVARGPLI